MVNRIIEGDNNLVPVDYRQILTKILQVIAGENETELFKIVDNGQRLIVYIDTVASKVANSTTANILQRGEYKARVATVNFSEECRGKFPEQIREIRDALKAKLEASLIRYNFTLGQFVEHLTTNLRDFQNPNATLNLSYTFKSANNLQKKPLIIQQEKGGSKSCLKFHKLTITVSNLKDFDSQLKHGLQSFIQQDINPSNQEEEEELQDILTESSQRDFELVKRLMDTEALGQLKKEATIKYLEYIRDNISSEKYKDVYYLEDLIRRLRLINTYLNDPNKGDGDYEVSYQGVSVNLRQILSRAEAFEALPIIPIIAGYLGETYDENNGKKQFTFGLKMKLNGHVQAYGGTSSFEYHLDLINPEDKEHKEQLLQNSDKKETFVKKVLKVFFLYYFIFASRCDLKDDKYQHIQELDYNPIPSFEAEFLPKLKGNNEEEKKAIFIRIRKALLKNSKLQIETKLKKLVQLLKLFLDHIAILKSSEYPLHIGLRKGILEKNIDDSAKNSSFFKPVLRNNPKESLQYISVENASLNSDFFCQLPVTIKIEDIRYQNKADNEQQQFSMRYDLGEIKSLPILLLPADEKTRQAYNTDFKQRKLIVFHYKLDNEKLNDNQYFSYYFTFFLLTYICIKLILDESQERLFIPILRLHIKNRKDENKEKHDLDKDVGLYSKALAHLLNDKHLSNSQGLDITRDLNNTIFNAMCSLYSVIPRTYHFSNPKDIPKLEKLAILIISSRECDSSYKTPDRKQRISNLIGEVITINRQDNGGIRLELSHTIGDNYQTSKMYRQAEAILDAVTHLRDRGYHHILYIAKAPYTSSLNLIPPTDEDDWLFFHSQELIGYLKQHHQDLRLYPIFFDKYYVRKLNDLKSSSLYIQNHKELAELMNDPSRKAVMFFNLFNGLQVGKDRFYNGVISYTTLLDVYEKTRFDDEHIWRNLIYEGDNKNDILQYLTLFHFFSFEQSNQKSLKLDPYEHIIGDESVGKKSLFKHINKQAEFNVLAFLTEVRKALYI